MNLFGDGRMAAAALRARVLQRLGAEPEWTNGDTEDVFIRWTAGPATTFLAVTDGPDDAPDLGVFWIFTPVATVGDTPEDMAAALSWCSRMNSYATSNRWAVRPMRLGDQECEVLQVCCSFVVGPGNRAGLESFAAWSVREQIAAAVSQMRSDAIEIFHGDLCVFGAQEEWREDWHEAARYYDLIGKEKNGTGSDTDGEAPDSGDLVASLRAAFSTLRDEMLAEGTGVWFSKETEASEFSCEMPAGSAPFPDGEIHWNPEGNSPPTANVLGRLVTYPHLGNGLLVTMYTPGCYRADSDETSNRLNRLFDQDMAATHYIGGWFPDEKAAIFGIFLPAVLLSDDIDWPAVMREILLTFARQAQLARRVVLDEAVPELPGGVQPVGFEASMKPRGLAWGETGEGRNPAAWYLGAIYKLLIRESEWAYPARNGFVWWPYEQAQTITVVPRADPGAVLREVVRIRVTTEVRAGVRPSPETLVAIARRNAGLAESVLVVRGDGTLILACQLVMTEALAADGCEWVRDLAVRQFVTARELAAELAWLGTDAASAHPVSGPRQAPDSWFGDFGRFAEEARASGRADLPESRPQVALLAAGGQYALPYRALVRDDGCLEFSWRPGHTFYTAPADPEVRVTAVPGTDEAGPAWIIRTRLPVTGDDADKARWCQDRNAELLLAPEPPMDLMVTGGWGLTAEGECCLTTGQARRFVRDDQFEAARGLGYLLREDQSAVVAALRAAPQAVRAVPLTAAELAAGLDTVPEAFRRLFGAPREFTWLTEPGAASAVVTCGAIAVEVPVGYGRPQLALVYGELLTSFPNASAWLSLFTLFPGPAVDLAFQKLEREGSLWRDEAGDWVFDAGHTTARLETRPAGGERSDGVPALRVIAIPEDPGTERFEATIPPAQFAWPVQPAAVDVLAFVGRQVIGEVRRAAQLAEPSRTPAPRERPRLFGSGRFAAATLRARLLDLLGAEPEWMTGDHDAAGIGWNSGLATTMFEVSDGAEGTPDLGVLRVFTPVAVAGNGNAARDVCAELNAGTGTARWSVAPQRGADGSCYDEVQVSCAFVVGPHNRDALESFALWCVREQIATATAHIRSGDVASAVSGTFIRYAGFPAGDERADWHPVVSFAEEVLRPGASLPADVLGDELLEAFHGLRGRMFDERTSAWFTLREEFPLTFETPFGWQPYPGGVITRMRAGDEDENTGKPPTALVECALTEHAELGNGLRIAVHVPRDPAGNAGRALNALNRLDAEVAGSSHSLGGWTVAETAGGGSAPGCVIFLPAAFAESVANRPFVMREILLTLARQALLARRVLVPPERRSAQDQGPGLGLAAAADPLAAFVRGPHGLAWGETGEGRNPAARVLDQIYDTCVGPDADWADVRADGFTWWPYRQAQHITATLRSAPDVVQGVSVRIATEVRRAVPVTQETLRMIAELNAGLGQAALVLREDGLLFLASRLYVHEGIDRWANRWAQVLAAEQFITARDMSARMAGLGEDAVSAHPFSGARPEPDELFGTRENSLIKWASEVRAGLGPLVPLLGLCRLYALPLGMAATDSEGGLDFTWRLSQYSTELPADPVVRVSVRHGDVGSGPGWTIRSVLPAAGDAAAMARWCNERNLALLGDGDDSGDGHTVVGGWGLSPDGECCLTTWMSPFFVPADDVAPASGLVGNVLSYHADVVVSAVREDSSAVPGAPVGPSELARGLSSVLTTFGRALEYPEGFRWSVVPGLDDVVVTLTGPGGNDDFGALVEDDVTLADDVESRTVLRIPLVRNRAELGLLYAAFLGRSVTRIRSFSDDLVPGEYPDWDFTWRQIEEGLGRLDDEGLIDWVKSERAFVFDAGPTSAFLRFERLEKFRRYGVTALRLTATALGGSVDGSGLASDGDVLGSWKHGPAGVSYEVTIPPAGNIFHNDLIAEETVAWVARHIVSHVREALAQTAPVPARPDLSWHDHGDGTGAIMFHTAVVASFKAELLSADRYGEEPVPDRREETHRHVMETTSYTVTDDDGGARLTAWVAGKWQQQLDAWWLFGEPVFWCEHLEPDDDDQPVLEWFMHFPAVMACDRCAERIREFIGVARQPVVCHSCGEESDDDVFVRSAGMSVIANYQLCRVCSGFFTSQD